MLTERTEKLVDAVIEYVNSPKDEIAAQAFKDNWEDILDVVDVMCWREDKDVPLPEYAHADKTHATDACCDMICTSVEVMDDGRIKCGTGLHVALPPRYSLDIRPNSRITKNGLVIANSPCTIDESYRGEIFIVFRSIVPWNQVKLPRIGNVIGQCHVTFHPEICFHEVDHLEDLGETDRGDGGFGSTERKSNK